VNFYFVTPMECCERFAKAKLGDDWKTRIRQKVVGISLDDLGKYQEAFIQNTMSLRRKRVRVDE